VREGICRRKCGKTGNQVNVDFKHKIGYKKPPPIWKKPDKWDSVEA
jgi:hypothetical protein